MSGLPSIRRAWRLIQPLSVCLCECLLDTARSKAWGQFPVLFVSGVAGVGVVVGVDVFVAGVAAGVLLIAVVEGWSGRCRRSGACGSRWRGFLAGWFCGWWLSFWMLFCRSCFDVDFVVVVFSLGRCITYTNKG